MKLMFDIDGSIGTINEAVDEKDGKKKSLFIEGIFAQAEKKNHNRRIYPKAVLESAIDTYIKDYVDRNCAMGELNHPEKASVNPDRACILIKELKWDGNNVVGKAKVLSTPKGEVLKSLLSDGVRIGVSTRAVGSVTEKDGINIVNPDLVIHAIDCVSAPSGPDCWVDGIMENIEYYYNNAGVLVESKIDEYEKHIRMGSIAQIEEDFKEFLSNILL